VALAPAPDHVTCQLALDDVRDLPTAVSRCRRLLDLDADPEAVVATLGEDPALRPLLAEAPGRRIPRSVDEHELAVRVVLGQQVSIAAARTHAARLVAQHGTPITDPAGGLTHVFPTVDDLAAVDPSRLALPGARRRCLVGLITSLADGTVELDAGTDWARVRHQLEAHSGIGPWSSELIAMRGLGDPDAFPATDMGVRKGAAAVGLDSGARPLLEHAQRWRPWRSYAVQYLWAALDHPINRWPPPAP
jgi:AraC family transcriptional regulator of adaptative response / DNA-3-methyladenine glycosylase II